MKEILDNFSTGSEQYMKFRPVYPASLYDYIYSFVSNYNLALDCATGNGQVAQELSRKFHQVIATDVSSAQIERATVADNIKYRVLRAEEALDLEEGQIDLITVAQAIHWFDISAFFTGTQHDLSDEGVLAIWGYGLLQCEDALANVAIKKFYKDIVGPYWDIERKHVDESYSRVRDDRFILVDESQDHSIDVQWSSERLAGYLSTWSSVKHYVKANNADPVAAFFTDHEELHFESELKFSFPIFIKIFKKRR